MISCLLYADDEQALTQRIKFRLESLKIIRDAHLLAIAQSSPEFPVSQLISKTGIAREAILITIYESPATNPTEVKIKEVLSIYLAQKEALFKSLP